MRSKNKLIVESEDREIRAHPHCPHGPTLLFYYENKGSENGYYSCSAHRDGNSCNTRIPVVQLQKEHLTKRYNIRTDDYKAIRGRFVLASDEGRHFCHTCNYPIFHDDLSQHASHEVQTNISKELIEDPTYLLRPIENDKVQAQYFFDNKTLSFFKKCAQNLQISKIICIGAPRLHSYLHNNPRYNIKSFLLDLDHRFNYFFEESVFAWYNMCNNHFFDPQQEIQFHRFLECRSSKIPLIFIDPPFGCRTEPIVSTIHQITRLFNKINSLPHTPLPVFWIFPYFSAKYIQHSMPELLMCDYKVGYTNHSTYSNGTGGHKFGSPARVFTNIPLGQLCLPLDEKYKYCTQCQKYTALENKHCAKCGECPSRNGRTYRHCSHCGVCVKSYYGHCQTCRRCVQTSGHNCRVYQTYQRCRICLKWGHIEKYCTIWQSRAGFRAETARNYHKNSIECLLCKKIGHNEQRCESRGKFIEELTFLGETQLKFKT